MGSERYLDVELDLEKRVKDCEGVCKLIQGAVKGQNGFSGGSVSQGCGARGAPKAQEAQLNKNRKKPSSIACPISLDSRL